MHKTGHLAEEAPVWYEIVRNCLLNDILSFWKERTADYEYGGYITSFDREGNCTGKEKNIWLQARQVWMFATIYSRVEKDPVWLELAKRGRDYLVSHACAGNGRWYYLLDENGTVQQGTISLYTDMFVLMALSAYAEASGLMEDKIVIQETFDSLYQNVRNDNCRDTFPQEFQEGVVSHGRYMICLNAVACAREYLDGNKADELIRFCMDRIFGVLGYGEDGTIYEARTLQGGYIDSEEGHRINPGHIFESMWFVLEQAERVGRLEYEERALHTIMATFQRSRDEIYGGILHMLSDNGTDEQYKDWNAARNLKWDEKVWWTQAEALCALLTFADRTGDDEVWKEFKTLFLWCREHFFDPEYREWYAVLNRNGSARIMLKGGIQKAAFHIPRALFQCSCILKKYVVETGEYDAQT